MVSEQQLRVEAVRRRLEGESPTEIAAALGRTTRWVRKWVARHDDDGHADSWAESRSRAPLSSPTKTPDALEEQVLASRARLVANPRAQYGSLAIQWDLRRVGVESIPPARTIERILERAEVAQPRRRRPDQYQSKNVPYPIRVSPEPGTTQQIDMIGPRHLFGAAKFHTLNLIDVGSHRVGNDIVTETRPSVLVQALCGIWGRVGVPSVAQFDNHANFRGGIPPAWQYFSPIVATCLDLDVTARFIPVREPWRNGVVEHFNDVWDKSFFRTEVFNSIDHLRTENLAFVEFHNTHHRYSAHAGSTPNQMWTNRLHAELPTDYQPPSRLPAKGRIEVVRYIRSNRELNMFGKRITLGDNHIHQYVTAVIKVRTRKLIVVDINGEIIHHSDFNLSRELR
jgi:putative transposase